MAMKCPACGAKGWGNVEVIPEGETPVVICRACGHKGSNTVGEVHGHVNCRCNPYPQDVLDETRKLMNDAVNRALEETISSILKGHK